MTNKYSFNPIHTDQQFLVKLFLIMFGILRVQLLCSVILLMIALLNLLVDILQVHRF